MRGEGEEGVTPSAMAFPRHEKYAAPNLSPRHGREEGDFPGAGDRRIGFDMGPIDGGADQLGVSERKGIFLPAPGEPGHEIGDGRDFAGRFDDFLALADTFADPGE